jgi:tetratricopeptide (TPR) repeat protein/mono/diheme cytochrome c family protein
MNRSARRRLLWALALAALAVAAAVILLLPAPGQGIASGPPPLAYVGAGACAECHAEETERWRSSHHSQATQEANGRTVLGDFADAVVKEGGVRARFHREGDGFFVWTQGADGRMTDFRVRYAIGVFPLQQYLVELPGGRYQVLGIAWDARPRPQGGQRWFDPNQTTQPGAPRAREWTSPSQNWNSRCGECHSTDLRKGYRQRDDRFATGFSALAVSCEACHGPGSRHLAWARRARAHGGPASGDPQLVVRFGERRSRSWQMDVVRGTARPVKFQQHRTEVETCARCHSRRRTLTEDYWPGHLLAATHRPALLEQNLYYADGQARGDVYEWGSFLQSRMYAAGITCADCHDAHDQKLKIGRDEVCFSCHQPERYANRQHHFHREGSKGSSCIACHMPSRTDLGVRVRHDHSLRVPRPDLTVALGARSAPNACNDCHRDRSARWSAAALRRFFPEGRSGEPHYGEAIAAGRGGGPAAERQLLALARDARQPGIARATAVSLLPPYLTMTSLPTLEKTAQDPDPLVRLATASVMRALARGDRLRIGVSLLWDPVRAVRIEAVPAFADVPDAELESEQRAAFDRALDDYLLAQRTSAERPDAHVRVARIFARRGRLEEARRACQAALRIDAGFVPAYLELAELLRLQGRDGEGEPILREALRIAPESAAAHHALGLLLTRRGRSAEALAELGRAFELDPQDTELARHYALRLESSRRGEQALLVLREAQRLQPGARELLTPLVTINRERGAVAEAQGWAHRLLEVHPDDPRARELAVALGIEPAVAPAELGRPTATRR